VWSRAESRAESREVHGRIRRQVKSPVGLGRPRLFVQLLLRLLLELGLLLELSLGVLQRFGLRRKIRLDLLVFGGDVRQLFSFGVKLRLDARVGRRLLGDILVVFGLEVRLLLRQGGNLSLQGRDRLSLFSGNTLLGLQLTLKLLDRRLTLLDRCVFFSNRTLLDLQRSSRTP
jgi:hypothetical protein